MIQKKVKICKADHFICRLKFIDDQDIEKDKSFICRCFIETSCTLLDALFDNFIRHNEADIRFRTKQRCEVAKVRCEDVILISHPHMVLSRPRIVFSRFRGVALRREGKRKRENTMRERKTTSFLMVRHVLKSGPLCLVRNCHGL
jgi:hypothetical protein